MNEQHAARCDETAPSLIARRDFLLLGTAAAVGAVAVLPAPQAEARAGAESVSLPLSLGFVAATIDELRAAPKAQPVIAVERLGRADRLDGAVRVKVHGIVRASSSSVPVSLDALYRVGELDRQEIPFLAWSDHDAARRGGSSALGFPMHAEAGSPPTLALTARSLPTWRDAAARRLFGIAQPSTETRGRATLLYGGVYFLAVPAPRQEPPNWALVRVVAPADGTLPRLEQATLLGSRPVSFDYIVLAAERA